MNVHDGKVGILHRTAGGFAAFHRTVVAELQVSNQVEVSKCGHLKVRGDGCAVLDDLRRGLPADISAPIG